MFLTIHSVVIIWYQHMSAIQIITSIDKIFKRWVLIFLVLVFLDKECVVLFIFIYFVSLFIDFSTFSRFKLFVPFSRGLIFLFAFFCYYLLVLFSSFSCVILLHFCCIIKRERNIISFVFIFIINSNYIRIACCNLLHSFFHLFICSGFNLSCCFFFDLFYYYFFLLLFVDLILFLDLFFFVVNELDILYFFFFFKGMTNWGDFLPN